MVKKKLSLWEAIVYYKIIWLLLFGTVLYFTREYIFYYFINLTGLTPLSRNLYDLAHNSVYFALAGIWFIVAFLILRDKRYYRVTGRNYGYDSGHYRPYSYGQLVDYFKDADPHKLDTEAFPEKRWQDTNALIFGRDHRHLIHIPSNSETNIAVFGPPGSGKTSGIAIINALRFSGSVLAIDIKGDIYNFCHKFRKIIRFCPDHPNALKVSYHFDPLKGIKDMNLTAPTGKPVGF